MTGGNNQPERDWRKAEEQLEAILEQTEGQPERRDQAIQDLRSQVTQRDRGAGVLRGAIAAGEIAA